MYGFEQQGVFPPLAPGRESFGVVGNLLGDGQLENQARNLFARRERRWMRWRWWVVFALLFLMFVKYVDNRENSEWHVWVIDFQGRNQRINILPSNTMEDL